MAEWQSGGEVEWRSSRGSLARRVAPGQGGSHFPSFLLKEVVTDGYLEGAACSIFTRV